MKKLLSVLMLLLALVCVFAACDEEEAPHTHAFGEWSVTTAATCTTNGEETRSCACGESETQVIAATGVHVYGEWVTVTAATCQVEGAQVRTCACGESETKVLPIVAEHSYTGQVPTSDFLKEAASCESPAKYFYKCAWCDAKGTETYLYGKEQHNFGSGKQIQTSAYLKSEATCLAPATYYYCCETCSDPMEYTYTVGDKVDHDLDAAMTCSYCEAAFMYFGEYPQSLKADAVIITATTDDRGYFLGDDGAYYAKVVADPYFLTGYYVKDQEYYFKVEPLLWRIMKEENGKAMIICDRVIAAHAFGASNNYAQSSIRTWINSEFYDAAFSAAEESVILTTVVDNSVATTGRETNEHVCENTNDKLFLLSNVEAQSVDYGFGTKEYRASQTTSYAVATGVMGGVWYLRSPDNTDPIYTQRVGPFGEVAKDGVFHDMFGVRPAMWINVN